MEVHKRECTARHCNPESLRGRGMGHGCEGGSAEPLRPKVGPMFTLQPFLAVVNIAK